MTLSKKAIKEEQYKNMLLMGYDFVLKEYGIAGIPNIVINRRLSQQLARIKAAKDQYGNDTVVIEVSDRVMNYYTELEREQIIKHELVHYAFAYLGKDFRDGSEEFENELKRLNLPSGGEMKLKGKVFIYSCSNSHNEVELHRILKRTNVDQRICPCCGNPMKYKGEYLITDKEKTKLD